MLEHDNEVDTVPVSLVPYLRHLLRARPIVSLEWDTQDLYQELSFKYLTKISKDQRLSMSDKDRKSLLKHMAANLCSDKFTAMTAKRRDVLRNQVIDDGMKDSRRETVEETIDKLETLTKFKRFLGRDLAHVFELRCEGFSWEEISGQVTPKRLSNTWARAFQRKLTTFALRYCMD